MKTYDCATRNCPGRMDMAALTGSLQWLAILIILVSILSFQAALANDTQRLVTSLAIVNGDTITSTDLDKQLMVTHRQMSGEEKYNFDYGKLLTKLVNDRLIIQEAIAIGMDSEESTLEVLDETRFKVARKLFLQSTFSYDKDVAQEEIDQLFELDYKQVQFRSISLSTCAELEDIAALIKQGASMDSIAKEISIDSKKFMGGLQSIRFWFNVSASLRVLTQDLKVGEMTIPFEYQDACMILRIEDRHKADPKEKPRYAKFIKKSILEKRREQSWIMLLDSLEKEFPIELNAEAMANIKADASVLFRGEFLNNSETQAISIAGRPGYTESYLRRKISHTAMNDGDKSFDYILNKTLDQVKELLLLDAAARDGDFALDPVVLKSVQKTLDSLLIETYITENIIGKIVFNRAEFEEYYNEHIDDFRQPEEFRLFAMQLADEETANTAMRRLKDGADFNYVTKQMAMTDGVAHDGNRWFKLSTFPDMVAAELKDRKPGSITKPFKIDGGWVIFRIRDKREGQAKPMDEVDLEIRGVLFQRKFDKLLDSHLDELKEASEIMYFDDAIADYLGTDSKL